MVKHRQLKLGKLNVWIKEHTCTELGTNYQSGCRNIMVEEDKSDKITEKRCKTAIIIL
jgi:hypothetical protein